VYIIAAVLGIVFAVMVARKNPKFLLYYEVVMIISVGIGLVAMFVSGVVEPSNIRSILTSVVSFIIWTAYFRKSVRVRTYMGSEEYLRKSIFSKKSVSPIPVVPDVHMNDEIATGNSNNMGYKKVERSKTIRKPMTALWYFAGTFLFLAILSVISRFFAGHMGDGMAAASAAIRFAGFCFLISGALSVAVYILQKLLGGQIKKMIIWVLAIGVVTGILLFLFRLTLARISIDEWIVVYLVEMIGSYAFAVPIMGVNMALELYLLGKNQKSQYMLIRAINILMLPLLCFAGFEALRLGLISIPLSLLIAGIATLIPAGIFAFKSHRNYVEE
jgi:hypothetical protein